MFQISYVTNLVVIFYYVDHLKCWCHKGMIYVPASSHINTCVAPSVSVGAWSDFASQSSLYPDYGGLNGIGVDSFVPFKPVAEGRPCQGLFTWS